MNIADQKSSVSASRMIVYQKECVISNSKTLLTGGIGGCYVLVGHDPKTKYSFMAHVDDSTDVSGVRKIFSTLKDLGVALSDLKNVHLIGGYKNHPESKKWGDKIIKIMIEENILGINFAFFQKKCYPEDGVKIDGTTHYFGLHLVSQTGELSFFKKPLLKIEQKQRDKNWSYVLPFFEKEGIDPSSLDLETTNRLGCRFMASVAEQTLEITVDPS